MEKKKVNDCLVVFKSIDRYSNRIASTCDEDKCIDILALNIDSNTSYECAISRSIIPGTSNIQFELSLSPYKRVARGRASDTYHVQSDSNSEDRDLFFCGRGRGLLLQDDEYANSYPGSTKYHQHEAIWISLNGGENVFFKKHYMGQWRCETSVSEEDVGDSVTILIWIESQKNIRPGEEKALNQLSEMYEQQINCDVHFNFQDKNKKVGGHVTILSMRSPVFSAMFQNHMMKEAKTRQVNIEDIQLDIFKELLHYIYSGRTSTPFTEATALDLFVAADKYDISDLKDECVFFLKLCIRVDNAIKLMVWAQLHSIQELIESTLEFTAKHAIKICAMKDWEDLTVKFPKLCILATRRIAEKNQIVPDWD